MAVNSLVSIQALLSPVLASWTFLVEAIGWRGRLGALGKQDLPDEGGKGCLMREESLV